MFRAFVSLFLFCACLHSQTRTNLQNQVNGVLPVAKAGTDTGSSGLVPGTNMSMTGSRSNQAASAARAANAIQLSPAGDQTMVSGTNHTNFYEVPFTSFSMLAQGFMRELTGFNENPLFTMGRNSNPATIWIFNDRDGSDPVQSTMYLTSFITNNVNRGLSQQGTALSVQSRATGSGNFGFLAAATFNTQYSGSGVMNQQIGGWFATPQNTGRGKTTTTIGIHIANQGTPGVTAARGIEFENLPTSTHFYQLYMLAGNNFLGKDNTWIHKVTLGCPNGEEICSDTFANLGTEPNGTMKYCSDCTVATPASCTNVTKTAACTCAGSGTGAIAKRINGVWLCN